MKKSKGKERLEGARIGRLAEDLLRAVGQGGRVHGSWRVEAVMPAEAGALKDAVMERLSAGGQVTREGAEWRLTETGRARAVELVRAHRLVETYLARRAGMPAGELHSAADRAEHLYTPEGINALADLMNRPRYDPHGDPIPERARDLVTGTGLLLAEAPAGMEARIIHLEDEPAEDFRRLSELGLALELPLRVTWQGGNATRIELAGEELELPARLAAHVELAPLDEGEPYPEGLERLAALQDGETGEVEFISPACMGPERRRLLDMGMVPGSEVRREYASPFGSPVAYMVRGTTIGLRRSQARNIFIRRKA